MDRHPPYDEDAHLDALDAEALAAADPDDMLRAVASAGAQVRQAATLAGEADLDRLAADGRPRAVVVTGMGGSGISGDVLAAVAGSACPVPVLTSRGYVLPGWVGSLDLVIAVSCSGSTEETLDSLEEAGRRGARVLAVGAADSPLSLAAERHHGVHIPVDAGGRLPRANVWALSVPLLVAADRLGLLACPPDHLERAADLLDDIAARCRPGSDSFVNPAKALALEVAGALPMVWGSSELAGAAAYRFCCQLAENAKHPCQYGVLPEADHNQVVTFDGTWAGASRGDDGASSDFFADRAPEGADGSPAARLRLVLLRDSEEHPQVARRREVSRELAEQRGIAVSEVSAEGDTRLDRLASLVGLTDFASVYLALALGIDPSPITSISQLKERIAR